MKPIKTPKTKRHRKPTMKEKIQMYESVFHEIYLCRTHSLNNNRIQELLSNIENWSRAQGSDGPFEGEAREYFDYVYGTFWNLSKRKEE